jgi:hypothetical protein
MDVEIVDATRWAWRRWMQRDGYGDRGYNKMDMTIVDAIRWAWRSWM